MTLDSRIERLLMQAMGAGIEPGLADTIAQQAAHSANQQEQMGHTPVLLVPAPCACCCRASCAAPCRS